MSETQLIALVFDDEHEADRVLLEIERMQSDYLVHLRDAVVARRRDDGKVKLRQSFNLVGAGAVYGSFWGLLIGLIFGLPLIGAATGAATGAVGGSLSDYGVDDKWAKAVGERLQPSSSALFLLLDHAVLDRMLERLSQFEGVVLKTSLSKDAEEQLRNALGPKPANPEEERVAA
jgi:uncharacterized membrane protein